MTGAAANASCLVPVNDFRWLSGEQDITQYLAPSGYRSHFCARCGSSVPNRMKHFDLYWVPAGNLPGDLDMQVAVHLCVASKAVWDEVVTTGQRFDAVPNIDTLLKLLR